MGVVFVYVLCYNLVKFEPIVMKLGAKHAYVVNVIS